MLSTWTVLFNTRLFSLTWSDGWNLKLEKLRLQIKCKFIMVEQCTKGHDGSFITGNFYAKMGCFSKGYALGNILAKVTMVPSGLKMYEAVKWIQYTHFIFKVKHVLKWFPGSGSLHAGATLHLCAAPLQSVGLQAGTAAWLYGKRCMIEAFRRIFIYTCPGLILLSSVEWRSRGHWAMRAFRHGWSGSRRRRGWRSVIWGLEDHSVCRHSI